MLSFHAGRDLVVDGADRLHLDPVGRHDGARIFISICVSELSRDRFKVQLMNSAPRLPAMMVS